MLLLGRDCIDPWKRVPIKASCVRGDCGDHEGLSMEMEWTSETGLYDKIMDHREGRKCY